MKLHEEAIVETYYGKDLSDVETLAEHLGIETNIIDAEQLIPLSAQQTKDPNKIYLLKREITST